jgi:hypothetical protein
MQRSTRTALAALVAIALSVAPLHAQQGSLPRLESTIDTVRLSAFYELLALANGIEMSPDARTLLNGGPIQRMALRPEPLATRATQQPALAAALIDLLERENRLIDSPSTGSLTQAEMIDYRLDLVAVLAATKDPRAIAALSPWVAFGGRAGMAIVEFGELAVPALVALLDHPDRLKRAGGARMLTRIAGRQMELRVSDAAMMRIKDALLRALRND